MIVDFGLTRRVEHATLAGLGVTAQFSLLLQEGRLAVRPDAFALPPAGEVEFVVLSRSARRQGAAGSIAALIEARGAEIWRSVGDDDGRMDGQGQP